MDGQPEEEVKDEEDENPDEIPLDRESNVAEDEKMEDQESQSDEEGAKPEEEKGDRGDDEDLDSKFEDEQED